MQIYGVGCGLACAGFGGIRSVLGDLALRARRRLSTQGLMTKALPLGRYSGGVSGSIVQVLITENFNKPIYNKHINKTNTNNNNNS